MIRVDLGREEKAPYSSGLKVGRGSLWSDLASLVILIIGLALAFAPYLVVNEFKSYLVQENEEKMQKIAQNIAAVDKEIARFSPFKKELESYEEQKKLVKDRLEAVNSLLVSRAAPVNALDAVGQSLPVKTWLTGVTFSSVNSPAQIKVSGHALSNEDISDFVDKLSESIYFGDVKLEEVSTGKHLTTDVRVFSVVGNPKGNFGGTEPARTVTAAAPSPPSPAPVPEVPSSTGGKAP